LQPALSPAQFRAAIASVIMTILLGALDQTIVGVAVPAIARQLGGFEWMAWVISGYLIASTVVTPLYGKFSDIYGRRSVMSFAIVLFLLASVACALSQSLPQLVLARVLQGAGGGGLISMSQAVIADVVPLRQRGRFQSYISVVWAVASLLGPVVGGVFTQYLSWPWIFWINLPVGLLALVLVRRALGGVAGGVSGAEKSAPRIKPRIDVLGAFLMLLALTALLVPITRVGQGTPWTDALNLGCLAAGAVLLVAFFAQERRHPDPMVSLALFNNKVVVACCGLVFICFFNFIALSVLVPLRSQLVAGLSATDAGLRLLPMTLAIPFAAFISGRAMQRTGRVLPAVRWGVVLVPLGLLGMSFSSPTGPWAPPFLVLTGLGMGLQMPPALILVQQAVPRAQVGSVTGLIAFFRQLGGAIGIAVLSSVLLMWLRQHLPAGADAAASEGLGALLKSSTSASADGITKTTFKGGFVGISDTAFQYVMLLTAAVSMLSLWWLPRLPDLGAHDGANDPVHVPTAP
jgi:EmrB/QacA subfamily drug resistance transporter